MKSHTGKQVIMIHILPNISRSKGNRSSKLNPLIAYKVKNPFFLNLYQKCDMETSPRPPIFFQKNLHVR